MQLEEKVYAALAGASPPATEVGLRVSPLISKQDMAVPRIVYGRVSNSPITSLSGRSNLDQVRMQLDIYAYDFLVAKRIAGQARVAMEAASFKGLLVSDLDMYEAETKLYRVSMDFRCWHRPDL